MSEASSVSNDSIWWRDLKQALHQPKHGNTFQNGISWRVGCDDRIKFWEDNWINDDISLLPKYPRLYLISRQQNQVIQQLGAHMDTGWEWDFMWRRPLFDSEITIADSFLNDVEGKIIHPYKRDDWVWKADPSGIYSTQSAYNMLRGETIEGSGDGVFEELWKIKVPKKISVFVWRLIRDRLLTKTNLRRR